MALFISFRLDAMALVIKLSLDTPEKLELTLNGRFLPVILACPVLPKSPYSTPKSTIKIVSPASSSHLSHGNDT